MKLTKEIKYASILTICINLALLVSGIAVKIFGWEFPQTTIFITLFMFAYHCDIRILIGYIFSKFVKNKIDINNPFFEVNEKEYSKLLRLGVKKWKDHFITWDKSLFVLKGAIKDRINIVIRNNINAEIIHWVCFFVGLFAIPIGILLSADEWWIYLITAIMTSLVADLPPILIQRFNRYRLQRILKNNINSK